MRRTKVQIAVQIEPVCKDGVAALATVELSIAGVLVTLQGLRLRHGLDGLMTVELPMFDHPTAGRVTHIGLHDDLSRGIVDEIIAAYERSAAR